MSANHVRNARWRMGRDQGKASDAPKDLGSAQTVAVLLSTYNGEAYLPEQLASLEAQSYPHWRLLWRDDGSSDRTHMLMAEFAARVGVARCQEVTVRVERLGVLESFLLLLKTAQTYPFIAFADQDDVWLPDKLARAMQCVQSVPENCPTLYCGRQIIVDQVLQPLRWSPSFRSDMPFPSSLAQNIATGCTMLLNRSAARIIARTQPPANSLHDWWSYIVVTAVGGRVFFDKVPCILYRQHGRNVVGGARAGMRTWLAFHRRRMPILRRIDAHAEAVQRSVPGLSARAQADLTILRRVLRGSFSDRLKFVIAGKLRRGYWPESILLGIFFVLAGRL